MAAENSRKLRVRGARDRSRMDSQAYLDALRMALSARIACFPPEEIVWKS